MRFDDTLQTVLSADLATPLGRQAAYRQLVDLIGRGRVAADERTIAILGSIADQVPVAHRSSAARGLAFAKPPAVLVRLFVRDTLTVAAPVLRTAQLDPAEWCAILPELAPPARAILRHRRDLGGEVERALESFGPSDFVLPDSRVDPDESGAPAPLAQTRNDAEILVDAPPAERPVEAPIPTTFASVGSVAFTLPFVAEAVRHAGEVPAAPLPARDGLYQIADVVARIDAFTERRERERERPHANDSRPDPDSRGEFTTDPNGIVIDASGPARAILIGLSLGVAGGAGIARVDAAAAGAFRQRSRIRDAHLRIDGGGPNAGVWLISAVPMFDAASGRFTGYNGVARRPRSGEMPAPKGAPAPDALRQLVHELRTPTNAIIGFSEMIALQMLGPVEAPYRDHAGAIQRHARDLLGAIDDLDLAARIDSDTLSLRSEPVSLRAVLASVCHDLADLAELRGATLALPDTDGAIDADRHAVERLLGRLVATLLSAARRDERLAMTIATESGVASLSIDRPADLPDRVTAECDTDNDEGLLPALPLGTGFALRLADNLARELGGGIDFEASRIEVRLPAAGTRANQAATKS